MRKRIKKIATHPLIAGSFIIFSGGIAANFLNFLFNVFLSRNLQVSEYGVFISLIAVVTLISIPGNAIIPTIVSEAGIFYAHKNESAVKSLYLKILKPYLFGGFIVICIFIVFSGPLSSFLKIESHLLTVAVSVLILLSYLGVVNLAFLQAKLAFKTISVVNIISSFIKLLAGVALIFLGLGLLGAFSAYLISFLMTIVVGVYVLKKELFSKQEKKVHLKYRDLISYGLPSAMVIFSINSFIFTDIILVKHFFTAQQAGLYAGLSLVGRVIFYVASPINTVMFPIITNRFNKKENYKKILLLSLILVGGFCTVSIILYFLFPSTILLFFLKNKQYLALSGFLGYFSIFMTIYSVLYMFSFYFLSVKKTFIWKPLFIGVIIQLILITMFHSTFYQVIFASLVSCLLVLFYLLYIFFSDRMSSALKSSNLT